ncbi:MAG TPA: resolvase [Bacillota bacterium]|nr:resolvase [Bacillota bacterium]
MDLQGRVSEKHVVPVDDLFRFVNDLTGLYEISVIVIGNRTKSKSIKKTLLSLDIPVEMVEENNSTVEGRYRYLKENSKGLAKLLPIGLRIPAEPFDDYVAVILAERYLNKVKL